MPRQLFTSGIAVSSNQPEIRKRYNAQNQPYASRAEVFADNDPTTFYLGQTFFIKDGSGGVKEYWFESAVATELDLVLKSPESVRIIDSMASLKALEDLKLGDYVRTYGYYAGSDMGGGLFKVTGESYRTVKLNDGNGTLTDPPNPNPNPGGNGNINVPSVTVDTGFIFKMKFRINGEHDDNKHFMQIKDASGNDLKMRSRDILADNTQTRYDTEFSTPNPTDDLDFSLFDDDGNEIHWLSTNVLYGSWYEAKIEVMQLATPFTADLNIGHVLNHSMDMEVEWFEIDGNRFLLNEGAGSTLSSGTADEGTITGDFAWGQNDPLDDGALHIKTTNGVWLTKQIANNTVTPFDYGAVNNESVTDYSNDSTAAIQAAIDSGYNVEIPPSRLYITTPLEIKQAVQVRMFGSFMPMNDANHEITISDEANTTTILYSDQNIDYIIIRSRNVEIHNGLLYTYGSVDHSKAAILFDTSYPMWRTDIVGVNVYGNQSYLLDHEKVGTTAFKVNQENPAASGYLVEGHIDGRAYWCHKGVELTPIDPASTVFVNTIDFTVTGFGCQVYYDFAYGGLFNVTSVGQDANVLPPTYQENGETIDPTTHPKYTAFQFHNCSYCTFDVLLFDPTGLGSHNGNNYSISGANNTIKGILHQKYINEDIELYGVESLNQNAIIKDPTGLVITHRKGFISEFDNAIAFAGNEGNVSYSGYKAVASTYFEGNFTNPSDTYTTADVAPSADVAVSGAGLLTNIVAPDRVGHIIAEVADRHLHFAEIVIDDLENMQTFGNSALRQLLLSLSGAKINAIECILHFENFNVNPATQSVEQRLISPDNSEFLSGSLFNLFGYRYDPNSNNDALRRVIIRLIGQEGPDSASVYVNDIALETKEVRNKPNVNIGGDQTIYGQHTVAEQLSADEFRYINKSSVAVDGGHYGNEVLQLKDSSGGAIGLYNLNSNDDVIEGRNSSGPNVMLSAGTEVDLGCSVSTALFTTNQQLTPQNGTIDVIYRIVNEGAGNARFNSTTYITRVYADGVKVGEVTKVVRGEEKIESISFPVTSSFANGAIFSVTVESDKNGPQIGNAVFTTRLRLTKSFLVPRPGAAVADASGTTIAGNQAKINELLGVLRTAGFIQ